MQVVLGSSTYDVSHRAVVIGRLDAIAGDKSRRADACREAKLLVTLGADALAIDAATASGPARNAAEGAADTGAGAAGLAARVDALRSCAGVPVVVASSRIDVGLAAAHAGASVLLPPDAVNRAIAGGVPAEAVLLDGGEQTDAPAARHAYPVVVTTVDAATHAVAIVSGLRLLRTRDVQAARRVADVLAAIVDAASRPCPPTGASPTGTSPTTACSLRGR